MVQQSPGNLFRNTGGLKKEWQSFQSRSGAAGDCVKKGWSALKTGKL